MKALPHFLLAERDALVAEIETAFDGVTREGGVSWGQAEIADAYGDVQVADYVWDGDHRWQDLLDHEGYFEGIGVWPFLDAIGFRYYLPAAMTLSVRSGQDKTVCWPLTLQTGLDSYPAPLWSTLNLPQRRCVKRFLQYMAVLEAVAELDSRIPWVIALEGYWQAIADEDRS